MNFDLYYMENQAPAWMLGSNEILNLCFHLENNRDLLCFKGIQLGPTEASRYWIYWVPAQYIEAIKDTVLGRWQSF